MMPDLWSTVVTLSVIAGTVVFFILGKYRTDFVALCALLCLMLAGVLTPDEALAGFSNSIILTIGGMFIIGGAIVRSGLAGLIGGTILRVAGDRQNLLFVLVMLITALIGALVSNTGTVAIMMPIVVSMAQTTNLPPGRFLMPLAFMSGMGGMLTLVGNPPNMVANAVYVDAGYPSLTLFSFFPVGLVCMAFGMLVLVPATCLYLSRRRLEAGETTAGVPTTLHDLADKYQLAVTMRTIVVPEDSPMVGQSLLTLALTKKYGVVVREIRRRKGASFPFAASSLEQVIPGPHTVIRAGDIVHGSGPDDGITRLVSDYELTLSPVDAEGGRNADDGYRFESIGICELVLMSSSRLVGLSVEESGLRDSFGITVLGIQRGSQYLLERVGSQVMHAGDALLAQGSWEAIARLGDASPHWVVVGNPRDFVSPGNTRTMAFVAVTILLMIASMAAGLLPTVTSVLLASVVLILGRCFRNMEDVYSCINWEILIMIASMLPLAAAMEKTGLVAVISEQMTLIGRAFGPYVALAVVYGVTSALNIVISFTPLTLLVAPVALRIAVDLGCDPLPFIMAVATAASMCFASSFSTPSNALVVSVGRYTFMDYLKIGLPLQAALGAFMVYALPLLFPF